MYENIYRQRILRSSDVQEWSSKWLATLLKPWRLVMAGVEYFGSAAMSFMHAFFPPQLGDDGWKALPSPKSLSRFNAKPIFDSCCFTLSRNVDPAVSG